MKRIVVLGGGESGVGSAVLASVKGFEVFLSDAGKIKESYKNLLDKWGIAYEEGGHSQGKILNAHEVVKSPGIPDKVTLIQQLKAQGTPIISEIEFAGRYCDSKIIAITGSNGKTTTTTIAYQLLRDAGFNVGLGGNIGQSFALQVATQKHDWYVLELSSFQLDGMYDFRADIGVLMNITPDHLDRYDYCMENYVQSKFRILQNMGENDWFIYCGDDKETVRVVEKHLNDYPMHLCPFTSRERSFKSAYLRKTDDSQEIVVQREGGGEPFRMDVKSLKITGIHNIYNVMAAVIAARVAGVSDRSIETTLRNFAGVEHRMEPVAEIAGVHYINDSKATNVDSVWYALESLKTPTVWIAGGTDKGNDYAPLMRFAKEKVKVLVCMGVDNEKLKSAFAGVVPVIYDTHSLEEAMEKVQEAATVGDTVLLSPACASFDLFKNYEQRGELFKEAVLRKR